MTQIEQARRCFQTRDGSSVLAAKPTQIWASIWRDFAPLSTGGAGLGQLRLLVDLPGVRCSRAMEIATTGNSSDGGFFLSMAVAVCLRRRIRLRHVLCLRHLQLQRLLAVAVLMFSGVCATACLTIFFMKDVNFYEGFSRLGCNLFALSITLAFIMWSLQAASSFSGPDEAMMLTLLERINPDHGTTFTVLRCLRSACTNISRNGVSSHLRSFSLKVKKSGVYL